MVQFESVDDVEVWVNLDNASPGTPVEFREQVRCLCGRYAKWVGDQHYYNGQFDCYRFTVRCARCGDVDVECV